MPEGGGRRSRTVSLSGRSGTRRATEMAALILAQGDQNGNLDVISHDSKVKSCHSFYHMFYQIP